MSKKQFTCKLCKLPVDPEEYENFCGMHCKCENEYNDCMGGLENENNKR